MVRKSRVAKIFLEGYGSYLKMDRGCFVLRDAEGNEERYPVLEMDLGEIVVNDGNLVSTGALTYCGLWGVDVVVVSRLGRPIAMLRNFDDDSYVNSRIGQYESLKNGKGLHIAKKLLFGKVEGQNIVLNKYGLKPYRVPFEGSFDENDIARLRKRLLSIEGKASRWYFGQVFSLFNENARPLSRVTYEAYVGLNNVFNLAYAVLKWKVYRAITKAHLEPFLGYLHSYLNPTRPSLVCDFMELYRYVVDDFLIKNCRDITTKDFEPRTVFLGGRKAKRMFLKSELASALVKKEWELFTKKVRLRRMRMGESQEVETMINEEAFLFAKYLRGERPTWHPRIVGLS